MMDPYFTTIYTVILRSLLKFLFLKSGYGVLEQ